MHPAIWLTATLLLPTPGAHGDVGAADPDEPRRAVAAVRLEADDRIRLDGFLDERIWSRIPPATDFLQQEPRQGAPATERTEVRIAFDEQNLYLGVMLYDSDPEGVIGRALQRDAGLGADDRFMWLLDTFTDGRTGYFFEINPAGLMGDGLLRGTSVNKSWDGIWEASVRRGDHGWSAEIRIPFRTLNFDPARDTWGINFQRTVRRKDEESLWSGHLRNQGLTRPEHAGRVTGLEGMSQGVGLQVKPYAVASWQHAPGGAAPGTRTPTDLGLDVTYSITPALRASLTINTDFAEAEVDQRRVNLTRFPQSFPERRDFFLEGSSVYSFAPSSGPSPYFSRRIGLVSGSPVPIVAGARVAGQVGAHEIGFLQVRTGEHELGPVEDFTIARVRRNVLRSSAIGAIYTRRAREAWDTLTSSAAQTIGVDLDLFSSRFRGDRNLQFEAFFVAHTEPLVPAEGSLDTSLGDRSARGVRLSYPNDPIRAHVSLREFGTHYDPAVGFVPRRGFRRLQPTVGWSPRPGLATVRQLDFQAQLEHLTDLDGELETFNVQARLLGVRFESGEDIEIDARHDFERLRSDFEIHPGIVVPAGDYTGRRWDVSVRTASRRKLTASASLNGGDFWSGKRVQREVATSWKPRAGVSLTGSWERNDIDLPAGSFTTNLVRTGGGWQFSPWMSLNASAQYDDVTRVVGTFARFRWIVRPGSDLYLVYTHNLRERPLTADPRDRPWHGLETLDRRVAMKLAYSHQF